jgi:selenocysteine-specific elongation factor
VTLVVGTAGHIDHGKTTLLRALTGIDADRLPEERRRGLTIDVGYAHLRLEDGDTLDFVDVPGHDRLVGNMLVGAGEVDAVLLVVAADDGPRAQTFEHLGLLDALGLRHGLAVVTKADQADPERVRGVEREVAALLAATTLAGSPVMAVAATTGEGLPRLAAALAALVRSTADELDRPRHAGPWLAIDRAFTVRGRGVVVTGSSRGGPIAPGDRLVLLPEGRPTRVREVQVHDASVDRGPVGGRVALNLSGVGLADVRRGQLLSRETPGDVLDATTTDRLLVALRHPAPLPGRLPDGPWPPAGGMRARLHVGTDQVEVMLVRDGRDGRDGRECWNLPDGLVLAHLRAERLVATAAGERFVLRRPAPAGLLAGGIVLDPRPPRGPSRRRLTGERASALAEAVVGADARAVATAAVDLHGIRRDGSGVRVALDIGASLASRATDVVQARRRDHPGRPGLPLADLRAALVASLRRQARASRDDALAAADHVIHDLVAAGELVREGSVVRGRGDAPAAGDPAQQATGERLVAALDTALPPSLAAAAAEAGCSADTVRALEREGRIVVLADDLAWSTEAYTRLRSTALDMARQAPLTPAALRDATGTNRKVVMALLEDLDRRGILTRTAAGHVPGPRA